MTSKFETDTKQKLRIQAKKIRNSLDIPAVSSAICGQIVEFESYKKAKNVAGFYPFGHEIDLRELYQDSSKKFYLPRVIDGVEMVFYPFTSLSEMEKNKYGILEPITGEELKPSKIDLIIVPGLMADKKGHRLGYGKGYYDRFMAKLSGNCIKIIPIPEELLTENIPADKFDVPVDIAVTQIQIHYF